MEVHIDGSRPFALVEPINDCRTNAITFQSTRAGAEYMAPGVTGWTTKAGPHQVDAGPVADGKPLTLFGRYEGVEASYTFDFRAY
ncbi:hypothetical protein, partial [Streptococcus pneumoniae]|uniref:hypothetical protein n=1 Tax=Streptococcus pneumoniae TaxID=1313 RepID=UPI001E39438B